MLNPSDITADLPSPRDDEPENLRGDIRDELADHLQCAMRRELLSGAHGNNENAAWQNVLKRFGNPTRIALECWLIKMKGKLIMQRITLVASLLAVALCGIMLWTVVNAQHQGQQANIALVEKLNELVSSSKQLADKNMNSASDQAPNSWPRFKLRFVYNDAAKTPVVGQEISCDGNFLGAMPTGGSDGSAINIRNETISQKTDENGWVDYGYVHPDVYEVNATMPWGPILFNKRVRVVPGFSPITIVCPDSRDYRKIDVKLDVPVDLQNEKLSYFVNSIIQPGIGGQAQERPILKTENSEWLLPDDSGEQTGTYIFNSAGVMCIARHKALETNAFGGAFSSEILLEPLKKDFYFLKASKKSLRSTIVYLGNPQYQNQRQVYLSGIIPQNIPSVRLEKSSDFINEKSGIEFDPAKDQSKTWTVKMPDEFWKTVREELEPAKKEIAEQAKDPSKIPAVNSNGQGFGGQGFGGGGLF